MMSGKYKIGDDKLPHFVTLTVVDWIDVFTRNIYKDLFLESIKYCILRKGLILNAWVIMTNHVHIIMSVKDNILLSNILRDLKKYTSKQLILAIQENTKESRREWMLYMFERAGKRNSNNTNYQFWQQDNHPIELFTPGMLNQKLEYLHMNPVRAGIVSLPEDYLYSSAVDYHTNNKGIVDIQHLFE